jgi:phospholipid/cholesterol/gamma-HCH transport system substrate-binding protein
MAIEKNYRFPKDTTASILTSGLLGEQYIGLEGGGDDQMLKAGRQHPPDAVGGGAGEI